MSSKKFNKFKDVQSDQIQRSSRKLCTAHCACRNADLNLALVKGTIVEVNEVFVQFHFAGSYGKDFVSK